MAAVIPAPLPEGYYLDNFTVVLDHVRHLHGDLLTVAERDFAAVFDLLGLDARRLFVRLLSRKGPLFRIDRLSYPEISDIRQAVNDLIAAGLADDGLDATAEMLQALLLKSELRELLPDAPSSMRRSELAVKVTAGLTPDDIRAAIPDGVLRLRQVEVLDTYRLLFFGNLDQDFTEFILDELGITPYERYPLNAGSRLFDTRELVDQTLLLYALRALAFDYLPVMSAAELTALANAVPDIDQPPMRERAGRLLTRIARQLERLGELEQALGVYRRTTVAPSRERQARIHALRDDDAGAIALCAAIIESDHEESEYEFAVRFAHSRARSVGFSLLRWPAYRPYRNTPHAVTLPPSTERVEESVRQHFQAGGDEAWYVENRLFPGLFGLAFWDIIFHPVRGAFLHPFQRGPLDLFSPQFLERRRPMIEARLGEIAEASVLAKRIWSSWEERFPRANFFVSWGGLDGKLIERALERIPAADLTAVFRRLLRDPKNNRAGFPDLIVFPRTGGYQLVEVKGPGDTLQANQKRWLAWFERHHIPANVVGVTWE